MKPTMTTKTVSKSHLDQYLNANPMMVVRTKKPMRYRPNMSALDQEILRQEELERFKAQLNAR